jgi:hypothetical protein
MVSACVMNQSKGHWLLINELFGAITMSCKLKEEKKNPFLNNLMEDNVVVVIALDVSFQHKQKRSIMFWMFFFFS